MVKITINISRRDIKYLERMSNNKQFKSRLDEVITKAFNKQGLIIAGKIVRDYLSGQRLNRQSGTLARSITHDVSEFRGLPSLRIGVFRGPALKYAAVQEFGTKGKNPESPIDDIRPKNAKALTWPLRAPGKSPRDLDNLKFIPYRRGTIAIGGLYDADELEALRQDPDYSLKEIDPLFVLLRKLSLKPQYFLRDGVQEAIPQLVSYIARTIRGELAKR